MRTAPAAPACPRVTGRSPLCQETRGGEAGTQAGPSGRSREGTAVHLDGQSRAGGGRALGAGSVLPGRAAVQTWRTWGRSWVLTKGDEIRPYSTENGGNRPSRQHPAEEHPPPAASRAAWTRTDKKGRPCPASRPTAQPSPASQQMSKPSSASQPDATPPTCLPTHVTPRPASRQMSHT